MVASLLGDGSVDFFASLLPCSCFVIVFEIKHSSSTLVDLELDRSLLGFRFLCLFVCGGVGNSISTISSSESIISTFGRCVEDCLGIEVASFVKSTTESLSLVEEVELSERGRLTSPELVKSSTLSLTKLLLLDLKKI